MKQIEQIELPAYWASALINGDTDNAAATLEADRWLNRNTTLNVISCSDNSYIGRYDGLICDMLTYTVEVRE